MRANFSLDYDVVSVERPQKIYLMARFEAGEAPGDKTRRPLNLSLVIDRSGSMAGDKIDYTKQAAQFLIQHLGVRDTFSIVLYNDKVETLLAPEKISNKDAIAQLIERIRVRGTTNLSGGWLEGCKHVADNLANNTLNRVILMTDGLANRGVTDASSLTTMAKQKYEEGISTTTMGLGNDFNEDLMMEMASAGGGAFYFIESPEVTPTIFQEELSGLLSVVGQNLTITLKQTEHVSAIRQLNAYPINTDGKVTTFTLGDIFGNEIKTLVLELTIPSLERIGEAEIATLRFEYDEIANDKTQHQIKEVPVMVNVKAQGEARALPNKEVIQSVLLLKAAHARQQAVKAADKGDYETAAALLRDIAHEIAEAKITDEQLLEEEKALMEQADKMKRGAQAYDEYSRKTMSTQAFYTMTSRHDDTVMLRLREQKREEKAPEAEVEAEDVKRMTVVEGIHAVEEESTDYIPVKPEPGVSPTHLTWKGQVFELKTNIIRLGRSSHNEIIINEKGVSRFHGQIRRTGEKLFIEDLGSTNGTMVNGRHINKAHELSVGDVVYICDEKLIFHRDK